MQQRISLVTVGVADRPRARAFYEALGWRGQEVERTVFFQADPDGHAWEVAHNPGFALADDGTVTLPDFGRDR